ncbi:MAG: transcription-repair coupling factor [Oscillospiraceae bacterium]|nr:transcription-repair coupling factor [Oscillospiraceae bacterium]
MLSVTRLLERSEEYRTLLAALEGGGCPAAVSGLSPIHRVHIAAALRLSTERPVVLLCTDEGEAARTAADLRVLTEQPVEVLPAREFLLHDTATASREWEQTRLGLLHRMRAGDLSLIVATPDAFLTRTIPPAVLEQAILTLAQDQVCQPETVAEQLTDLGYSICDQVEGPGQFARRGGILDIWSPGREMPVRVEFFGDQIDAMGVFDPATQRRTENIMLARLLPVMELLPAFAPGGRQGLCDAAAALRGRIARRKKVDPKLLETLDRDIRRMEEGIVFPALDRYFSLCYPEPCTALDYLPPETVFCFCESPRVMDRAKNFLWQMEQDVERLMETGQLPGELAELWPGLDLLCARLADWPVLFLNSFSGSVYPLPPRQLIAFQCRQLPSFANSLDVAADDLAQYVRAGYAVVICCPSEKQAVNLHAMLREKKIRAGLDLTLKKLPGPGQVMLTVSGLSGGMDYPVLHFALLSEGSAAPRRKIRAVPQASARQKITSYTDLVPGDLVVHAHHGIGRFTALVSMQVDGVTRDYVKLAYSGTDTLYLPATQLDQLSKYIGGGEDAVGPKLSKLGGTDWARAKSRARSAVKDLAHDLIQLYAARQRLGGYAFPPDTPWQLEFEESFEYQETEDQLRCTAEIKRDMERPVPMDRLLCGDVGFGKTEVALRAVMKCVLDGKQAAILVPTTVLAQQHYLTACHRFIRYPVKIDILSRFRTPAQHKESLRAAAAGEVDVLIGTHRLLQKDVHFKDLGLVIIDEEQRFGVSHKERLKEMTRQVDVLTLTATPIPRTLNMALSGIRDMSTIEAPPRNRQPVQTYVLEHDWGILSDAIARELDRGGQVYYLHNRVDTIDRTAAKLAEMFPDAVVQTAHGRMGEDALGDTMQRMADGETQILVCTTIIETGIDIPNVNTLIIEDADHLGLAQLHQIRGRVGRSPRRAYAYMTYRKGKVLTEVAEKRLSAIREFAEFGSGFKIAMRDLEIRGAGNLLGPEQSGCMMTVGYDMYLQLLEEAVLEEQGKPVPRKRECTADLAVEASIPTDYVAAPGQRMDLYRRMAHVRTEEEADDLRDELADRYGDLPPALENLLSVALLRSRAAGEGITDITQKENHLLFTVTADTLPRVAAVCSDPDWKGRLLFSAGDKPCLTLRIRSGDKPLVLARKLVEAYAEAGE